MKQKELTSTSNRNSIRARQAGYILFGITVLACAAWIVYQYYLIDGWNLWPWIEADQPYDKVIKEHLTVTVHIVSVFAGAIGHDKTTKALLFTVCYLYTLSMSWLIPIIWHMHLDFTPVNEALEYMVVYGSVFSLLIIPSFASSAFVAWVTKALIRSWNDRHKANDGSAC